MRKLRLATGLTIFVYVTLHLVDHALLNISVSAADTMLSVQLWIWQGVLGTHRSLCRLSHACVAGALGTL